MAVVASSRCLTLMQFRNDEANCRCNLGAQQSRGPACAKENESRNDLYDERVVRNTLDILVSVFQLRRLEHTGDTHGSRPFFLGLASSLRFFLFQEQFGIVAGELLELNEEVSESLLEAVDVAVELFEGKDEGSDLLTIRGNVSI